jgi:hypothetical protein
MLKRYLVGGAIGLALLIAYGLAGNGDIAEAERQHERYCDMVGAWQDSDGEYGWPPYRENVTCED